jgi:outer membrane biosynthesis protein TonB
MSLKEDLLALVWKYGWKNVEEMFSQASEEVLKRSEVLLKEVKGVEDKKENSIEPPAEIPVEPIQEEPQKPEKPVEEPQKNPKNQVSMDKKRIQREKEKEKRQENEAKGVFAKDLLTKENLEFWKSKNYSNAYISREFVGCREEDVAKAKKKFNV